MCLPACWAFLQRINVRLGDREAPNHFRLVNPLTDDPLGTTLGLTLHAVIEAHSAQFYAFPLGTAIFLRAEQCGDPELLAAKRGDTNVAPVCLLSVF